MRFTITNQFSDRAPYICELGDEFDSKSFVEQLGAAIQQALLRGSDLIGCDLWVEQWLEERPVA